jgi:phosphatidylserine/phosphatidylglycerophosphate/cardiolipin synthase-like enzyme/uncharacterized membrane protein YdjX (TVP38/TMEM64 family)
VGVTKAQASPPGGSDAPLPLLRFGENCEGPYAAGRVAVLVDGEAYFGAVAAALEAARRRVLLVGWDFHTGVRLRRPGAGESGAQPDLVTFLEGLLRRRPALEIFVLEWDFAMLYALERQLLPRIRFGAHTHPRLHFVLDGEHPTGASHHQKLVVVDDRMAFTGGFDLAPTRWDTREHLAEDERRCDPGAPAYTPFHDVGMAVDGEAAGALAAVARERWQRATGDRLPPVEVAEDPWPTSLEPDLRDVQVGVARTDPSAEPPQHEVEALYLDAIRGARRAIYAENQYLTSNSIADALAARLREADGPDVVLVGPRRCSGWLEQSVMGTRRTRIVERLRDADRHGRLRLLYPVVPGVDPDTFRVHSKLMVVDDRLLRIGSANLANRSMGLDTELDLAIEAEPATALARRLEGVRDDLLGEHLGCTAEEVSAAVRREDGLAAAVDALASGPRRLEPLPTEPPEWMEEMEEWLPDEAILDPERPMAFDDLVRRFLPDEEPDPERRRAQWAVLGGVLGLALLAALWRFTPLETWARPDALAALADPLRESAWGPWAFAAGMALGGLVMLPVTAMIVASALVFGPALGFVVAWSGAMASALLGYGIGRLLWRDALRRLLGPRLRRLSQRVGHRGLVAVATLRVVPVAPYTAVNLAAGASHVGLRDYSLGTVLAMTPGILALTVLADRVARAVRDPGPGTVLLVVAVALVAWLGLRGLRRLLEAQRGR